MNIRESEHFQPYPGAHIIFQPHYGMITPMEADPFKHWSEVHIDYGKGVILDPIRNPLSASIEEIKEARITGCYFNEETEETIRMEDRTITCYCGPKGGIIIALGQVEDPESDRLQWSITPLSNKKANCLQIPWIEGATITIFPTNCRGDVNVMKKRLLDKEHEAIREILKTQYSDYPWMLPIDLN